MWGLNWTNLENIPVLTFYGLKLSLKGLTKSKNRVLGTWDGGKAGKVTDGDCSWFQPTELFHCVTTTGKDLADNLFLFLVI